MNIRASYRYQMADHKKTLISFYIIMLLIITFLFTTLSISIFGAGGSTSGGTFSGMDISSAIFLFVVALCSHKETFGMLVQNGVSRRTMFISRILTIVSIAFVMATIDRILILIFKALSSSFGDKLYFVSLYELIYPNRAMKVSTFQMHMEGLFFDFFMYLAFMAVGYLITTIFYRLNKTGKALLSSGLPISIFLVIPILDNVIANGRITSFLIKFIDKSFGFSKQLPSRAMISCTLILILFSAISWLFIRKANVKE